MRTDYPKDMMVVLTENQSVLRGVLTKQLGCPHSAEDVLQSLAVKLLSKKPKCSAASSRAYLFQMARNEAVSHHRSETARNKYESQSIDITDAAESASADNEVEAAQVLAALNASFAELSGLTRRIFFMYRVQGMKQRDIASELDINLSTVEKRLATAMKHFRKHLQNMTSYG